MKALFRELDLYKVIILASLVLLPVVGGWAYWLQGELEQARVAAHNATKSGGDLEEIGKFMKAIEEQKGSNLRQQDSQENPRVYFEQCIFGAQRKSAAGGLKRSDFIIDEDQPQRAGQKAEDRLVKVTFKRGGKEAFPLPRDFLLAMLFTCEAQSRIWKVRELDIRNSTVKQRRGSRTAPPAEFADEWVVRKMVFAARRPSVRTRGRGD